MKEACRFYSLLLPIKQHEALQTVSRKNQVPLAVCVRNAIDFYLENKSKDAKNADN